jgi:hypothetical protein
MPWSHTKTLVICDRHIKIIALTKDLFRNHLLSPIAQYELPVEEQKYNTNYKISPDAKVKHPQLLIILFIPD